MKNTNVTLTAAERKLIENFDEGERGREYGRLNVRKYNGFNSALLALNGTTKTIGTAYYNKREGVWYMDAINGERYRFPEPADGIDSVLEMEFKRKDV